jgi:excisionase family DNA binding protein
MHPQHLDLVADGLLTVAQAADFLQCSRTRLYEAMDRGELGYVKWGRSRRIPRRAVTQLAADNFVGGSVNACR